METVNREYQLLPETCDRVAEDVSEFCAKSHVDNRDAIICRLSIEDCLMYWINHGLSEKKVIVRMGTRMLNPYIILEVEGEKINPRAQDNDDYGEYFESIQVGITHKPEFGYKNGCNSLYFKLKRKSPKRFVSLGIALSLAILIGILGLYLPDGIRNKLLYGLVSPFYDAVFRVIKAVAGPMVFLAVTWGIYGIGDPDTLGRI